MHLEGPESPRGVLRDKADVAAINGEGGLGGGEGRGPRRLLNDQLIRLFGLLALSFCFLNIYFWILPTGWTVQLSLSLFASLSLLLHSCRTLRPMEGKTKQNWYLPLERELEWVHQSIIWRQCYMETVLYGEKCPG